MTKWLSINDIVRETGLTRVIVERRLSQAGLSNEGRAAPFDASVLEIFRGPKKHLIKTVRAREILRLSYDLLYDLISAGVLTPANAQALGTPTKGKRRPQMDFIEHDVHDLLSAISAACKSERTQGMISLRRYAKSYGEMQANVIASILNGEIAASISGEDGELIDRIFISRPMEPVDPGYITLNDAAKLLHIQNFTLGQLMKYGEIRYVEKQIKNRNVKAKLASKEDVEAFKGRYVPIGWLMEKIDVHQTTLISMLRKRKIEPAFRPATFRAFLIRRSDASRLLEEYANSSSAPPGAAAT